jgi:hypothetical protein
VDSKRFIKFNKMVLYPLVFMVCSISPFSFFPPPPTGRQEDVPVFEQAVVISDIERLCAWVPLFTQSDLITLPGPVPFLPLPHHHLPNRKI